MKYFRITCICLLTSSVFSGCATFSKDGGLGGVKEITATHLKQEIVWPKSALEQQSVSDRVAVLLKKPLDVESAVQVALLNNKDLQASFKQLGISEADVVQAGRFQNPRFTMLYARNNGEYKIEQALTFNIFSLITMPKMQEIERNNFEMTKQAVAINVINLAYETRQAYFNAVAANERLNYCAQVKDSAEASAELASRMLKAGNWNALEQSTEQDFYAEAMLDFANAKNQQISSREALSRLLAVPAEQFNLEKRLPDLPKSIDELQTYEKSAFEQRLDLKAMRSETAALAKQLGLTKATRFINVLEIGPARVL